MPKPKELLVEAHIPSLDNPDARLLNALGNLPTETAPIHHSTEHVLATIGSRALVGGYLSVDEQLDRHDSDALPLNIAKILTKPLDRNRILPAEGYVWSDKQ